MRISSIARQFVFVAPNAPPPTTLDRLSSALEGRYSIVREIGTGGMATVYLAEDVPHSNYDVRADGKFVMVYQGRLSDIVVIQNWTEEVKRKGRAAGR